MPQSKSPLRLKIARAILGSRAKEFIPPLSPVDDLQFGGGGRLNNYKTKPQQLSANVGWCYTANTAIADPCAAVQLKLYRKKKDGDREEILEHEILDLFNAPNLVHTGEQQRQLHFTYMNFVGEGYLHMMKGDSDFIPSKGKLPDALYTFPAHRVQLVLGSSYTKSIVKLGQDEHPLLSFIRDINPDPDNPYFGRSVITAAATAVDTEFQMKEWNRRFFANNARPSLVFKSNEPMDDPVYERWKKQFTDEQTGTQNAYKPLLIEGGDVTNIMSQNDLDFVNSLKASRDEILAMWRVSPGIIGSVESVNRSNLEAGFYIHALINVVPRVRQFVKQVNASLVKVYDPTLELDFVNPVPEDVAAKLQAATAGIDKWWTKDEVRDMYGEKPLPDGLGTQIIVMGKTPMTLDDVVNGEAEPEDDQNPDSEDDVDEDPGGSDGEKSAPPVKKKTLTPEERTERGEAKAARYNKQALAYEEALMTVLRQQFEQQRDAILQNSSTSQLKAYTKRAVSQKDKRDYLAALLLWSTYNDTMRKALAPILYALVVETGQQATGDLGLDPSMFNATSLDVLNYSQNRASKIAEDVNAETEKQLRATLGQGMDQGESDDQLRARIELVMGAALTYRSDRITTTETTRAQGFADVAAWQQAGTVTGKEWVVQSGNPCPFCQSMDGVIVSLDDNFYSLGDVVNVDGKTLNIDYDDIATPPIHPNCQCILEPIVVS